MILWQAAMMAGVEFVQKDQNTPFWLQQGMSTLLYYYYYYNALIKVIIIYLFSVRILLER